MTAVTHTATLAVLVLLHPVLYELGLRRNTNEESNCDRRTPQSLMTTVPERVWPNAAIPFLIDNTITESQKKEIRDVMQSIQKKTCIRFERWLSQGDNKETVYQHVRFVSESNRTCATVGLDRSRHRQHIYLSDTETNRRKIFHDLFHILGRYHEHTRPDRDSYITVDWNNILPGAEHLFEIETLNSSTQNLPYDYDSVMHFRPDEYAATEGEHTYVQQATFPNLDEIFGGNDVVTGLDYLHIYLLYCESTQLMTKFLVASELAYEAFLRWVPALTEPLYYTFITQCRLECELEFYLLGSVRVPAYESSIFVRDLLPASECKFTLFSVYNPASLDPGISRTILTSSRRPGKCPSGVTLIERQAQSLTFAWNELDCVDQNGPIMGYECHLYMGTRFYDRLFIMGANNRTITFEDLPTCTCFKMSVAAFNEAGTGDHSPFVETSTLRIETCEPAQVQRLTSTATSSSIKVVWRKPFNLLGHATEVVGYKVGIESGQFPRNALILKEPSIAFSGLEPNTLYKIDVRAISICGMEGIPANLKKKTHRM